MQIPKKQLIKTKIEVHDRSQLETIFDFFVRDKKGHVLDKRLTYDVDVFFFLPSSMGIDPQTYPKEEFYRDIRPMLRYREPRFGFKYFLDGETSFFSELHEFIERLEKGQPLLESTDAAIDKFKIAVCSYVSLIQRKIRKRTKKLTKAAKLSSKEECSECFSETKDDIDKIRRILGRFFEAADRVNSLPADFMSELKKEFDLVCEYALHRYRDGLFTLLKEIQEYKGPDIGAALSELKSMLVSRIGESEEAASLYKIPLVSTSSSEEELERFSIRRGMLKRRAWNPLFLFARTSTLFRFQRQTGAMVAAGLAAAWAVVGQIIIVRKLALNESVADLWGISGMLFMGAAILFYIIKDRIKEVGRNYFRSGFWFRRMPDMSESIDFESGGRWTTIGKLSEAVRFLDKKTLPESVRAIRSSLADYGVGVEETNEHVIHYTKRVAVECTRLAIYNYPINALHDIMRFDLDAWLSRLADPWFPTSTLTEEGRVEEFILPKNYYLDLLLKHRCIDASNNVIQTSTECVRLVLNKKGLLRIDHLTMQDTGNSGVNSSISLPTN